MEILDSSIFDLSPIPMWLEDFSAIKTSFDAWRAAGIQDLREFLISNPQKISDCAHKIKILKVNQKTLELFEARDLEHLTSNLNLIFKNQMLDSHLEELVALWNGYTEFTSTTTNFTLNHKALDIKLRAVVLPGSEKSLSRVLMTTEDISPYLNVSRLEEKNRRLAEARFIYSPTSLWVEDFSRIKIRLDYLKSIGIEDFRTFLDVHPEFIQQCIEDIIILDVNQATLDLFKASSKQALYQNIKTVFAKEMHQTFKDQLLELWNGQIHHTSEAINYALDGSIRHVLLQFTVFPGYEDDWGLVQLALTDITARKKAESYLEYLGKHDVLTQIKNRSFYMEEINRLERALVRPVSAIYMDMNGLKPVNDSHGHDAGDDLLRRMGNILNRSVHKTHYSASRIGGDEFVILMQGANETTVQSMLKTIEELLNVDNQYYSTQPISVSLGHSTTQEDESIEQMLKRADQEMYNNKKAYYKLHSLP